MSAQRTTPATLAWYGQHTTTRTLGFNPDGMCLRICRTARNLPSGWASAVDAQNATPAEHRVRDITKVRPGMVMYFDDPRDGNRFGHIVTVHSVADTIRSLADIVVWSNSVKAGQVVKVRADYFPRQWGDGFVFAATWLNGAELLLPGAVEPEPPATPDRPLAGDVVAWNVKVGDRRSFLDEMRALGTPPVIGLMETPGHKVDIRTWARRAGYVVHRTALDSQLLVRNDVELIGRGTITVTTPWRGPKGKRIAGRVFPWVRVRVDGVDLVVLLVHMPWNPIRNARAWIACARAVRRFAAEHPGINLLVVGDLNQRANVRRPYSMRGTANKIGGQIIATGALLDYAIYRPARSDAKVTRPRGVSGRKGARMGSDHPVVAYNITQKGTTP